MNNLCRWLLAVTLSPGPLLAAPPVNEVLNLAGPVLADEELDKVRRRRKVQKALERLKKNQREALVLVDHALRQRGQRGGGWGGG